MKWLRRLFGAKTSRSTASTDAAKPECDVPPVATPEEVAARFGSLARLAVHLRPGSAGFTRLGGLPDLPPDAAWPEWNGVPQAFLAQVDLAEIHAVMPSFLPSSGFLYFFYDQEQGVWGFDPKDRGGWRVIYSAADRSTLQLRPAPDGLDGEFVYKVKHVAPFAIELLPDSQRLSGNELDWDRDGEVYSALRQTALDGATSHQMLGFPTPVQGDEMELECQLASNGIYVGGPEGYQHPRRAELEAGASEWKLLLQLDSDDDTGWMWGDVGTIYYWVRESDARAGDFSKVWMVFQCC
jgi:uncharacterized protein YwqG